MIKLNVELEQLRFKTDIEFSLDITNQIILNYSLIAALITQPFIDNVGTVFWISAIPLINDEIIAYIGKCFGGILC